MGTATPFEEKEANDSSGFLLWQVTMLWQRSIALALRPHDLTQVQFALLAGLLWLTQQDELVTQVMLARHAKLDLTMTSQVLRALESKGLVKRQTHPNDGRAKVLLLTKKGRACAWKAIPEVEHADGIFFGSMGEHRKHFNVVLRLLIEASAAAKIS